MKLTKNEFSGGRNTDTNKSILQPNQYLEAHNLELVADSNFYALQNIKGTTYLKEILNDATVEEIGAFATKYLISDTLKSCITYFTVNSTTFNIWCYDTEANQLYALYQETIAVDYNTPDRVIDAINYPENGIDFLYFTDDFNELRFIKCEIPGSYSPNFLTAFDVSLQRKGAVGAIALTSISSGGNLLSGTYQFAYRACDPINKRFTKWSAITNPVHVYDASNSSNVIHAGIGLLTDRKITLSITPSTDEATNLGYIQLAVIENVASTFPVTASLLEYTPYSTSLTFEYKANTRVGTISLDDLTVDLAQIETVKTLRVSNNRLFGGNVKYVNLVPENDPVITSGSVITKADSNTDAFSGDDFASRYVGYWRGEVYRFGIVYEDGDGNKSSVIPLDLSGVTNNQISGGLMDLKFPSRSTSNTWTLFNNSGKIQSIGLKLSFSNQVTWAKKVHIVRLPRKKNILFQTPVIPMMGVNGIGALGNYPSNYVTKYGNASNTSAQPQTQAKVLIPKNLFWPEMRSIIRRALDTFTSSQGEALISQIGTGYQFSMIFPSPNMYGDAPFVFTGVEKLDFVDRTLVRLNEITFDPVKSPLVLNGDDVNTNISGNFYGLSDGDYFFDSAWAAKTIIDTDIAITDYQYFDNLSQPSSVAGVSVLDYAALQTTGVALGYQPNIQRSAVIKIGTNVDDLNNKSGGVAFANGTLGQFISGGEEIVSGTGLFYESASTLTNKYINEYASFSNNGYVNALSIANVKLNLNDNRYGDLNSFHEYQFTGSSHTFSPSEVTSLEAGGTVTVSDLEIWGGDCFVGPQVFKVCDSTYSVMNEMNNITGPDTSANLLSKWGLYYQGTVLLNTHVLTLPVAVENAGQYVTVVLESEYNGEVRDFDVLTEAGSINGIPYLNNTTKDTIRTPLTYKYNINLSRQNSQKVFESLLQFSFQQTEFHARVPYSDLKVYNSDQAGFDVWRVADFVDLPEQRYGITSLAVASDSLYAIQEKGIIYLPIGERQIEQTDASTLAVRTGDVVGRPIVVDSKRGSQHLRAIVETGKVVYIPDNINKSMYVLAGTELKEITQDNQLIFRTLFDSTLSGKAVRGVFDFVNNQYWLIASGKCEIFNEKGMWVGDYEFEPYSAVYLKDIFVTDKEGNSLRIYSQTDETLPVMLAGVEVVPRVKFCINPDENFSKTFDVLMLATSDRLLSGDITVENESAIGNQTVTGIDFDVPSVEGNFRIPTPRDSNGFRLRGLRALLTIRWQDLRAYLQAVYTKYDLSKRSPF